jgi:hypothetical protein
LCREPLVEADTVAHLVALIQRIPLREPAESPAASASQRHYVENIPQVAIVAESLLSK